MKSSAGQDTSSITSVEVEDEDDVVDVETGVESELVVVVLGVLTVDDEVEDAVVTTELVVVVDEV